MALQTASESLTTLPHIDKVIPFNEGDHALMKEIKSLLIKHNAQDRFGVMLLHDHFILADDEAMIETEDTVNRTLISTPIKRSTLVNESTIETQWRLDSSDNLCQSVMVCRKIGSGSGHEVDPNT